MMKYVLVQFHVDATYYVCNKRETRLQCGSLFAYFGKRLYKARILMEHSSKIVLETLLNKLLSSAYVAVDKLKTNECTQLNANSVPQLCEDLPEVIIMYQDQSGHDFIPVNQIDELLECPSICQISYTESQTVTVLEHDYITEPTNVKLRYEPEGICLQKGNMSSILNVDLLECRDSNLTITPPNEIVNNCPDESIVYETDETALLSVSDEPKVFYEELTSVRRNLFPEDHGYLSEDDFHESDPEYIPPHDAEDSDSALSDSTAMSNNSPNVTNDALPIPASSTLTASVDLSDILPTPTPYGEMNITFVPASNVIVKKYFCMFCKKLVSKIARHLEMVHKDEEAVKAFSILPKCNPERRTVIDKIRATGTYEYNTNINYNNGDLKVCRRPQDKKNRKPTHYECCPKCKDYFSKITYKRHCDKCLGNLAKNDRSVVIMGKRCRASIHSKASSVLKNQVFPPLREDDVIRCIRYDEIVILFANLLCQQYRSPHNFKMIRSTIRLIGRFLLIMRRLEPSIKKIEECFQPKYFERTLVAIDEIAELDSESHLYKKPSVALHVGTILRKLANFYISECIKKEDHAAKKQTKDFLSLMNVNFNPKVSQTAFESQLQISRKKKIEIPSMEDVRLLNQYLNRNLKTYYDKLSVKYDYNTWKQLASFTLLSLIFFNRRRVGETERLKTIDFENYQCVDETADKDIFNSLSEDGKKAAQSFVRVVIRGKLGRTVAILLNKLYFNCVKLILHYREMAGVLKTNPYVFGLPNEPDAPPKFLEACVLMRIHSTKCKALKPHLLRGTILRKHIATQSVLLNLTDEEVSDLASYLGHADKIHKSHYRLPIVPREIAQISKLLQKAQGDEPEEETDDEDVTITEQNEKNRPVSQVNREINENNIENGCEMNENTLSDDNSASESTPYTCPESKRHHVSKMFGPITRTPWTSAEKKAAESFFNTHLQFGRNAKLTECAVAIQNNPQLRKRSPQQLKTWINNQILKDKRTSNFGKKSSGKNRWTTPEKQIIETEFVEYYNNEYLPSAAKCEQIIGKHPILKNRHPVHLKAKINNDIKRKQKERNGIKKLRNDMSNINY